MIVCERHGRLRCDECAFVDELKERITELQKSLEQAKEDFKEIVDKVDNSPREEYADYERLVSRISETASSAMFYLERRKSQ